MSGAPRAIALGASLAFGTCHLTACEDAVDEAAEVAPVAAAGPAIEQAPEPPPAAPDLGATEARAGEVSRSPGFTPDPTILRGVTAGGPVDLAAVDDRCSGFAAAEPDAIVRTRRPFAELAIMVTARVDTTLFVVGPDGEVRCGDDADGVDPVVRDAFGAGLLRVWVGVTERDERAPFVLGLSELDDTRPVDLAL